MEYVTIVIITIALLIWWQIVKKRKAEKEGRKRQVAMIAFDVQDVLEKISTLKTTGAKVNNCVKAIALLNKAEEYQECREVITNFDELKSRLIKIQKILPVIDYVEKAHKHQFKGKNKSEQNSLLDALYEIRQKELTNQDFIEAEVFPEGTDEIITIEGIEKRLAELGWKEN
jgi:GTP1/Obg family GTP-binding protein